MEEDAPEDEWDRLAPLIGDAVSKAGSAEHWVTRIYGSLMCSAHSNVMAQNLSGDKLLSAVAQLADANYNRTGERGPFPTRPISAGLRDELKGFVSDAREVFRRRHALVHGHWVGVPQIGSLATLTSPWWNRDATISPWNFDTLSALRDDLNNVMQRAIGLAVAVDRVKPTLD